MVVSSHRIVLSAARALAAITGDVSISMLSSFTGLANNVVEATIRELIAAGGPIRIENGAVKVAPRNDHQQNAA